MLGGKIRKCHFFSMVQSGKITVCLINVCFIFFRFPNDPCTISGGSKNGTCYTTWVVKYLLGFFVRISSDNFHVSYSEECSSKGGVNAGSCASGFGTCCTCKKLNICPIFLLLTSRNFVLTRVSILPGLLDLLSAKIIWLIWGKGAGSPRTK